MVKPIWLIVVLFAFVLIESCGYFIMPTRIKHRFSYCYDSDTTNINNLINTNGIFVKKELYEKPIHANKHSINEITTWSRDTINEYILFFVDGTFVKGFDDIDINRRNSNTSNIDKLFSDIADNPTCTKALLFNRWFKWGLYTICADTIKTKWIMHFSSFSTIWYSAETWYKVIDKNTIKEIYSKSLHTKKEIIINTTGIAKFEPKIKLPVSNCWLKNKKWFWCDENEWKNYTDSLKLIIN